MLPVLRIEMEDYGMVCTNCGNNMPDEARFCAVCGAPLAYILNGNNLCPSEFNYKSPDSFMALEEYPSEQGTSAITESLSEKDRKRLMSVIAQRRSSAGDAVTALSDAEVKNMIENIKF